MFKLPDNMPERYHAMWWEGKWIDWSVNGKWGKDLKEEDKPALPAPDFDSGDTIIFKKQGKRWQGVIHYIHINEKSGLYYTVHRGGHGQCIKLEDIETTPLPRSD